ncbi:hypothetical protein K474DRAFT_1622947 [Panus rudis PR-1116 ss-1]|nr:hypothetical protein K474DRAFT_1622947 [Panus rudis PR-1116 ss-1]
MSTNAPIVFYDIPGKYPERKAWSPNTWNTRFALNYKGIKYRTEWIEYPDIEGLYKKLGTPATSKKADGSDYYTLPLIHDPSTNTIVSDSLLIARYLDRTYPDTPPLFPKGTHAVQAGFIGAVDDAMTRSIFPLVAAFACNYLNESSHRFFRETREPRVGKLEEMAPWGTEKGEEVWKRTEEKFGRVADWLDANKLDGTTGPFVFGENISHADTFIGGRLIWAKTVWGEDSREWKRLATWHGGRWDRFLQVLDQYSAIV